MNGTLIVRRARAIDTDALRCRGCDAPTRPGAHFCVVCGRRFTAALNVDLLVHRSRAVRARCERCTAPVRETTRFCTTCGIERRLARLYSA